MFPETQPVSCGLIAITSQLATASYDGPCEAKLTY